MILKLIVMVGLALLLLGCSSNILTGATAGFPSESASDSPFPRTVNRSTVSSGDGGDVITNYIS